MPNPNTNTFTGKTFGRWTVLGFAYWKEFPCGDRKDYWNCKCQCGKVKTVGRQDLIRGHSRSCGCLQRDTVTEMNTIHGMSGSTEFEIWKGLKARCYNKNKKSYKDYGGRGIKVCDRWLASFKNFLDDMGPRPSLAYSIDRWPDPNGNYEKTNCRWGTRIEQGRNTRRNVRHAFNGKVLTLGEWGEIIGIDQSVLRQRIFRYGWSVDRALTTPNSGKGANGATYA
jgi:hypothetical protein